MNLEHVKIEMQDEQSLRKFKFVEDFSDMHTHDIIRYANSRNLRHLEWADMVSLVHELADRLETSYVSDMERTGF